MRPSTRFAPAIGTTLLILAVQVLSAQEPEPIPPGPEPPRPDPITRGYLYSSNSVVLSACAFRTLRGSLGNIHCNGQFAAFYPEENSGALLRAQGVPVDLPHGAIITAVWGFWRDRYTSCSGRRITCDARASLHAVDYRKVNDPTTDRIDLAWVYSTDSPFDDQLTSDVTRTIDNATVDRSRFNYYVDLSLPPNVRVNAVVIQYDPPR